MSGQLIDLPLRFKVYALLEDGNWTLKAGFESDMLAGAWTLGIMAQGVPMKIFDGAVEVTEAILTKTAAALQDDPAVQEMLKKQAGQL